MGPEATVLLMQRLIAAVKAEDDADHIPLFVDMNPQVPSRIRRLIDHTGEDPGPVLAAIRAASRGRRRRGTRHNVQHRSSLRTGDPRGDEFALYRHGRPCRRACSSARGRSGAGRDPGLAGGALHRAFDRPFADIGLQAVYPADAAAILAAIRTVKAEMPTRGARDRLGAASAELLAGGAALQMIASTELSLLADAISPGATAVDTLDVLVEGIVHFACVEEPERERSSPKAAGPEGAE